jgi:DNA-binding LytR/AlgR family response regulator
MVDYVSKVPSLHLVEACASPLAVMDVLRNNAVDLLFLDVQMPELTGISLLKALKKRPLVILTTAYSEYALEGYELDVADYLLKPIRLPRFLAAVQKAVEQLHALNEIPSHQEITEDDYIFVKTESKGKLLKINLADIDFIESMKNYVAIHRGGQKTLVYTSMKELEERLPKKQFLRVHKSFIIPIFRITGIEGNLVRLKNTTAEILIGENYKAELMEIIRGKMIQ